MEIGFKSVFIDTAPFIYFIEKDANNPHFFETVRQFFMDCVTNKVRLLTSAITIEEYTVHPYQTGRFELINEFDRILKLFNIEIISIDEKIAHGAAKIRSKFQSFRAMDALQLATAVEYGCDVFFTNDKRLKQFDELQCMIVSDNNRE